jgi:formylglycine-generating enzyme required for sulfatase activity
LSKIAVTWFEAVAYCRWLSEKEGIAEEEMCYPRMAEIGEGMKLGPGFLNRTGYRLPTEAEWKYVCKAQTDTRWFYGSDPGLLSDFAWFASNSQGRTHPVGSLKPNSLGLFDIHGNVQEWCHDRYSFIAQPETPSETDVLNEGFRVWRGGGFESSNRNLRSAVRVRAYPSLRSYSAGFRIAHTLPTD